jgi:hypothetical protein
MTKYLRAPYGRIVNVAVALVGLAGVVTLASAVVTARHERRVLEHQVCAVELAALKQRAPIVQRMVLPAQPCDALKIVVAR